MKIPFRITPRPCKRRQRHLDDVEMAYLEKEVERMLQEGAIREMSPEEARRSVRSSIYTVPKKGGVKFLT